MIEDELSGFLTTRTWSVEVSAGGPVRSDAERATILSRIMMNPHIPVDDKMLMMVASLRTFVDEDRRRLESLALKRNGIQADAEISSLEEQIEEQLERLNRISARLGGNAERQRAPSFA